MKRYAAATNRGSPKRRSSVRRLERSPTRVRLSREGRLYLLFVAAVLVSAVVNEINLLILLAGLMAGPLIFGGMLGWWVLRRIEVRRSLPSQATAGQVFEVPITLINRKWLLGAWSVTVEDQVQAPADDQEAAESFRPLVWFGYVPARRQERVAYRGLLTQRGRYEFGPLTLRTRFPLGLVEVRRSVLAQAELVVYPRLGRLSRRWQADAGGVQALQGGRRARAAVLGEEYHSLRDFRPGDNWRWIHWRTTARKGQLMVREFEDPGRRHLGLLLDLWMGEEPSPRQLDLVELAVSFAATVCAQACRSGSSRLVLILPGESEPTVVKAESPTGGLGEFMACLAEARPHSPNGAGTVVEQARPWLREMNELLVVTTRPVGEWEPTLRRMADEDGGTVRWPRRQYIEVDSPRLAQYFHQP